MAAVSGPMTSSHAGAAASQSGPLWSAGAPAPVIEIRNLSVRYGDREVLKDLTCSLSGRTIGLLGPNGAGKSTLINTLLGFVRPASGSASIFGHAAARGNDRARLHNRVGYMPENDAYIADMNAVTFIRMMGELSGLPAEAALERAHEALFYVGLGEARYRRLGTYSLGMKQMAKLAQAIVHGPRLLILDEPTNSLDPPARLRMIRLIREIRDTHEVHIVVCSHLLRDVEETCEEVVILKQGRLVHQANLAEERRANLRFLELETHGETGDFAAAIQALGCEVAPAAAHRLRVTMAPAVEVRDIYRLAEARRVQLRRLSFRRDTLEDIFMRAMEN